MSPTCSDCDKKIGKIRGHIAKYAFDFPNGVEEYKPDDMDDYCTCLSADGATMEQRKDFVALKRKLAHVEELLDRSMMALVEPKERMDNMYKTMLKLKFNRGFCLGYMVGVADVVIVWTLWAWRAELLNWWVS